MNSLIALGATLVILLLAGGLLGLLDREHFSLRWLLVAVLLVALNDAMLTRFHAQIPELLPHLDRNWQGKLLALAVTLAIAALPVFGWRRVGLTLRHAPGGLTAALPVLALYAGFFLVIALAFPNEPASSEEVAFQLTLPGLEEEPFYRGILLFALDRAFIARVRFLGVEWGWGAVLSCVLFGMAHAFGYSGGKFAFDLTYMALTALPAFVGVWLRLRTGSLLLPVIMHNFGNAISLLI